MGDDIAKMLAGFIVLGLMLGVVAFVAIFIGAVVVPVALVGAGGLYYVHNIHLPQQRRREAHARTVALQKSAERLAPNFEDLQTDLIEVGITSPQLHDIAKQLFMQEGLQPPLMPPLYDDPIKLARFQSELEVFIKAANPAQYEQFKNHLAWALSGYESQMDADSGMFDSKRQRSKREVEQLILKFINDDGLFKPLTAQLDKNYEAENGVMPSDCKFDDYVWRYLRDTPLLPLVDVEERVNLTDRMYHTYLLGSSGSGKTNLLENIIAHDLASDEDCCVIVIDSQTQLTEKLSALDVPNTTFITPKFDLALNLFDVGYEEMRGRGIEGETLINKTVGLLSFVLEGMMWAEFTNPQKTIFQYVIQLVISIKGGNIYTFMDVLADGGHERYAKEIDALDENLRRFFTVDFLSPDYKRTREAIRRRMDSQLSNPTFRRLVSATENKIDMLDEMDTQNLILIDTNKPMLDDAPSAFFGRLFIALILRASYRRFQSGQSMRPVYLIVDEAHEYFDRTISDMLEQARKANIGLIVSHQSISQARGAKGGSNITDPLMVNTATKLIWTSFREDATKFAGSMQVKADDILNLPQFTFGMYTRKQGFLPVRGIPNALSAFERRDDPQALRDEMEGRYGRSVDTEEDRPDDDPTGEPPADEAGPGKPESGDSGAVPPDVEVI